MPYVDEMTENLMIQIIARDVAKGVEMARSLGHQMPTSYDVGVKLTPRAVLMVPLWHSARKSPIAEKYGAAPYEPGAIPYEIRIRMNDAIVRSHVQLPDVLSDGGLQRTADLLEVAWRRINQDAMTVPHAWISLHPEAAPRDPADALKRERVETTPVQAPARALTMRLARDLHRLVIDCRYLITSVHESACHQHPRRAVRRAQAPLLCEARRKHWLVRGPSDRDRSRRPEDLGPHRRRHPRRSRELAHRRPCSKVGHEN